MNLQIKVNKIQDLIMKNLPDIYFGAVKKLT